MILDKLFYPNSVNPQFNILSGPTQNKTVEDLVYSVGAHSKSLSAIGVMSQLHVAILLNDNQDVIEILLACWQIGAIPVLIPSGATASEIAQFVKNSHTQLLITQWEFEDSLREIDVQYHFFEELSQGMGGCGIPHYPGIQSDEDLCLILFTSGTTGSPKSVQLTQKNLLESASQWHEQLQFRQDDVYLNFLPIHHIGGISIFIRSLVYGFKTVQLNSFDECEILKSIEEHSVSLISLVPTMLNRIIKIDNHHLLKSLRGIILSGGPSSEELMNMCIVEELPIYKSYGMTETASGVCGFWLHKNPKKFNSVGQSFEKTNLKIKDGILWVNGPSIMIGYVDDDIVDEWFNTGDYANIDEDGFINIEMRREDRIVTGGENVNPSEIEFILCTHPQIKTAKVYGKDDNVWGQIVVAQVSTSLNPDEICQWLQEKISPYKIPKLIEIVD